MTNEITRQLHQKAGALLDASNLPEARNIYQQIYKIDNGDAEACMMLGAIEGELGRINDAMHYLREAIRIQPDYTDPRYTLAHLLAGQGRMEEACDELSRVVEVDPDYAEAWDMLGGLQGQLRDFENAERSCCRALELDNGLVNSRLNLAHALMEQGKDEDAIAHLRVLTENRPELAPPWALSGALLARKGELEAATQALHRALALNPDDQESKQTLALVLTQRKDYLTAIPLLQEIVSVTDDLESCWFALLACSRNIQQLDALLVFCEALIDRFPQRRYPSFIKGMVLESMNRPADALRCYKKVTELAEDWPLGWARAGLVQLNQGDLGPAEMCLGRSLSLGIDDPAIYSSYAQVKSLRGDHGESERYARMALDKTPDSLRARSELAAALLSQGRLDEGIDVLRKGLSTGSDDPENLDLIGLLANAYEHKGEYEKAYGLIRPYLDAGRREPVLIVAFASMSRRLGQVENALRLTTQALESPDGLSRMQLAKLYFSAGDLYDYSGSPDEAISHYHKANQLYPTRFNREAFTYLVDETIRVFSRRALAKVALFGNLSRRPVFIVGMPRSGTSLLEQILASHPEVFGAGELREMRSIAVDMGLVPQRTDQKTRDLDALRPDEVGKAAKRYLDMIGSLADSEQLVTDKAPANFLALGLIQVLFPNARIIHSVRDPMDNCLSCYFNYFGVSHGFTYSLDDLGFYYNEYRRLMDHWRQVLSLDFLEVGYEDLVVDQAGKTREMLEFCKLPWSDRTLDFHKTVRTVRTLSYDQVRQPVYRSSIGRWKAYEAHLGPLKDALNSPV